MQRTVLGVNWKIEIETKNGVMSKAAVVVKNYY